MMCPWRRKENLTRMRVALAETDLSIRVDNKMARKQTLALDLAVDTGIE